MRPQEAKAVRDPRALRRGVDHALLLERRPHYGQEDRRHRVRDGVDEERQRAGEAEERSTDRRRGEADGGLSSGDDGDGVRELLLRHDGAQRARRRGRVDDRATAFDERDDRDHPERDVVERDQHTERPHRRRPHACAAIMSRRRFQ